MAFVAPEGITTTFDVANTVGIGGMREVVGLIFELVAHSGFNCGDLWEWLRKAQPRARMFIIFPVLKRIPDLAGTVTEPIFLDGLLFWKLS